MATLGDAKYGLSIKYKPNASEDTFRTKTINYINVNGTGAGGGSTALGLDGNTLYDLGTLINTSLIGGTAASFILNEGREITNG